VREPQDAVTLADDLGPMSWAEATLETAISVTCVDLSLAINEAEQRQIFARLQALHVQRTKAQVERMEKSRGLRR
jgi:hypothetical protein